MNILFIYPNDSSQLGFNYGVAHISAMLKKAGHRVELLQFCSDLATLPTQEEFTDRIKKNSPDIIGFSVVTNQWPYAEKLAGWAKKATSVPIVCGGIHAMAAAEEILQTGVFDYIVRGEAEEAFLEFAEKLDRKEDVTSIKNIGMVNDNTIQINPMRALPDLKKLPFKDYKIFDFQKIIDAKNGWVGLMASRGCPFSCTYCFNHQMVATYRKDLNCSAKALNYIRHFDVQQVIDEIVYLTKNYTDIKTFIFDDDLFTFYSDYVRQFCDAYKKTCSIPFVVNAHVGFFDEQRAKYLADANCKIVKFGVESGSPRIRVDVLKRRMTNKKIIQAIKTTHKFKMHSSVFLMIGLPGETHEDLMATINLMGKAKPGRFRWSFFFPFPGTKAYQASVNVEKIDHNKMEHLENFTEDSCLDFGEEQNLFLKKAGLLFPWFVNAASDLPVAEFYKKKVEEILALDATSWEKRADEFYNRDKEISQHFVDKGLSHYAIKYNPFMGVISDYFTVEE